MNRVGLVQDPSYVLHSNGPEDAESPERLRAIEAMLEAFQPREQLVALAAAVIEAVRVTLRPWWKLPADSVTKPHTA